MMVLSEFVTGYVSWQTAQSHAKSVTNLFTLSVLWAVNSLIIKFLYQLRNGSLYCGRQRIHILILS
jgi:hypothetical protein